MQNHSKTALIAGASRGLGLAMTRELARRGWNVIATIRGTTSPELQVLIDAFPQALRIEQLDIAKQDQINGLRRRLEQVRLDLLLANAGISNRQVNADMSGVTDEEYTTLLLTNALGPVRFLETFETLVPNDGVMAAMSSILGSLTENTVGMWPAYASSKSALNMLLHDFASRRGRGRAVVAMAPGWVRTEMGGATADLSIEESVPRVIDVLTEASGKSGLRYLNYDGRQLPW